MMNPAMAKIVTDAALRKMAPSACTRCVRRSSTSAASAWAAAPLIAPWSAPSAA